MSWTVSNIEDYWVEYLKKDYVSLSTVKKLRCLINGVMLKREKVLPLIGELWQKLKPDITDKMMAQVMLESKGDPKLTGNILN